MTTALTRALELLADPPADPGTSKGYLDLLGTSPSTPQNTGAIQRLWASPIGSMLYDNAQVLGRKLLNAWQHPAEWLNIPTGGVVLDVGSGPGNVTAELAREAGPGGLALGVDISEPMLARAVRAEAGPQVGFLRADAQRLPFRDEVFDALTSMAVLQLIPEPRAALAEMVRVLKPGARPRCASCQEPGHTSSATTNSVTRWRIWAYSGCGPRASPTFNGYAASGPDPVDFTV
jgi:arsenite methyltransferase